MSQVIEEAHGTSTTHPLYASAGMVDFVGFVYVGEARRLIGRNGPLVAPGRKGAGQIQILATPKPALVAEFRRLTNG